MVPKNIRAALPTGQESETKSTNDFTDLYHRDLKRQTLNRVLDGRDIGGKEK
jgi:hypothetical protein